VQRRQKVRCGEYVFVQMESGATYGLPAWMLSAACATCVLGPPLVATGALLELRALLSALPSDPQCDKASLKLHYFNRWEKPPQHRMEPGQVYHFGRGEILLPRRR